MFVILSLILALATLVSTVATVALPEARHPLENDRVPAIAERYEPPVRDALPERAAAPEDDDAAAAVAVADYGGLWSIEYEHYDPDTFYAMADGLRDTADGGDADETCARYDALYEELLYIDALDTYATVRFYDDMSDEYWSEEYTYADSIMPEIVDAFEGACWYALGTDCGDAFADYIGADATAYYADYEPLTEEELAASLREIELLDEYYALYDAIDGTSYEYGGETWTTGDFFGARGDELAMRDYDEYLSVYYELQRTMCLDFAPVYIELVQLWAQEARDAGYDDLSEYIYTEVFGRDFTPGDAQTLCDEVKPIAQEYYSSFYYSDLSYAAIDMQSGMDADEAVAVLGEYLPRIDESLLAPWTAMTAEGLYDIADADGRRYDGAFTTEIPYTRTPFLFSSVSDSCYDFITLTHEYGHFTNAYFSPIRDAVLDSACLDLCEIHSNGLQALFTEFYGEIFGDDADIAEFANISFLLENILDGCIYDEFQRRVFESADTLTPEDINRIFIEVRSEYGVYEYSLSDPSWDAEWVYISHSFESPLYYISYASSAMAALQIWDAAQKDFQSGVDVYLDVLHHGAYEQGYFEVLSDCGLRLFSEPGTAEAVCRPVIDRLTELERAWRG